MTEEKYFKADDLKHKIDYYKKQIEAWGITEKATLPNIDLKFANVDIDEIISFDELKSMAINKYKALLEKYRAEFDNL